MLEKEEERKYEKHETKITPPKKQKNSVFGVVVNRKDSFLQKWHFKNRQTIFVFGRYKKVAHFRCNYRFWENGPFLCPFKVTKHYKNRDFPWGFTICDTQNLCSAENTIFIVFSAKHSFADMKERNLTKNKNLPKFRGLFAKCKKVFFFFLVCVFLFFFGGFVICCLCFCAFVFVFRVFFVYFVPPKGLF